jgi:NADH:ubiquinone oxidoreductase subunit 5 (subunit L)/multisubunit Na+/H+ antiporter MnhA subunit
MAVNAQYFRLDNLSMFVGIFIVFFSLMVVIYSVGFMRGKKGLIRYYSYILLTLLASLGVVFSRNLVGLMVCWGFLGLLLYLLIGFGEKDRTPATAKKTLIIVGGTDAFMLLGLAFIWSLKGSFDMSTLSIPLDNKVALWAYLCLAAGAFAKAGAMPFHTWVPDMAEDAPTPVTAFLPASLDKLLGIYFFARISLDVFQLNPSMNTVLMALGSFTIMAAVMMALVQHDLKRLLGYHAVSQVGYMILGIATANPVGIAGGLFHMLNHAIYKSCLFFSAGNVEKKMGTTDLEKFGGLGSVMPVTFVSFLIASFAISGVPPFNGFASKWMIYQGIIETGKAGGHLWLVWLMAAMLGSALTLASFMKLVHAVFLGQPSSERNIKSDVRQEVGPTMLIPPLVLAVFCVVYGVFAYQLPLTKFILPSLKETVALSGMWDAGLATVLILVGIAVGLLIYFLGTAAKTRQTGMFVGGELLEDVPDMRVSGTEFYRTVEDIGILKFIYKLAQEKVFDIYEVGTKGVMRLHKILSDLHNGVLPTYLAWCLLGMMVLFYLFFR